ncbi:MAG: hypothetical protein CMQ34_01095 [Gammaproteobacteria bacterium]|nr:hypothetical protein [Gammaproteobacteria bacterium]|tara:strand:+ start:422 stop:1063 length:642 start_codon:yes stop_codon:yes gene_type:complete
MNKVLTTAVQIGLLTLAACSEPAPPTTIVVSTDPSPADTFMANIAQHCGQSFAGRVAVNTPQPDDDPFAGQPLVMHVRECSDNQIRIPFHVGDNRSRTWILTRTAQGLQLKHDHRQPDGSDDAVTMYGGDSSTDGTAERQEFPADQYSIDLFTRGDMLVSLTNVWAMEIEPGEQFVYELARRDSNRLFRVEFDLSTAVATPPDPWGYSPLQRR